MKKLAIFVAAIALTLGLAQCKKEQTTTSNTGETVFITLNVDGGNNGTRADVDPSANQIDFKDGDRILVAYDGKYVGTLERTNSQFSGNITITENGEQPLYFYFLGNKQGTLETGATSCTVNISDQTSELPVISMGRSVDNTTYNNIVNYPSTDNSYTARLYNKCSLMKFTVDTPSEDAICIMGMNNEVTVDFSNAGFTYGMNEDDGGLIKMKGVTSDNNVTWAIVLPQDALTEAGSYNTVYTDADEASCYLGQRPAMDEIEMNKFYNGGVALTITEPKVVDLSAIPTDYGNINVKNGQVLQGTLPDPVTGVSLYHWYRVRIEDGATVTLKNVEINKDGTNYNLNWPGISCLGDATIILEGTNTVNGFCFNCPGIQAGPQGKTLTIKGSGSLYAQSGFNGYTDGGSCGAGIGCETYSSASRGNIRIEGGTITAIGGTDAAGIGGANGPTCGDITITGGNITARGGDNGAGIGTGGTTSTCGNILIEGGHIEEARGGTKSAGIGTTPSGVCGNITIISSSSGTAYGNGDAPCIGSKSLSQCGTIMICGIDYTTSNDLNVESFTWPLPSKH